MNGAMAITIGILAMVSIGPAAVGADVQAAYEARVFKDRDGGELPYRMLLPADTEPGRRYPLVLFLHGAGERGRDNRQQLAHGASLFIDPANRQAYPAIVVFPQCPEEDYWVDLRIRHRLYADEEQDFREVFAPPTRPLGQVAQLLDELLARPDVDPDRVYVMGLSMGAMGTYEALARWPERFAAAVAICGGGNVEATARYAGRVPVWITHGARDSIVPVEYSRRLHAALREHGGEVRYTEFPETAHDAWGPTFAIPELLPWLFSHRRAEPDAGASATERDAATP